jgi:hypothetical protein
MFFWEVTRILFYFFFSNSTWDKINFTLCGDNYSLRILDLFPETNLFFNFILTARIGIALCYWLLLPNFRRKDDFIYINYQTFEFTHFLQDIRSGSRRTSRFLDCLLLRSNTIINNLISLLNFHECFLSNILTFGLL